MMLTNTAYRNRRSARKVNMDWILVCVRKTNPSMTRDRLIEELSKCRYSAVALVMVCENDKKSACIE